MKVALVIGHHKKVKGALSKYFGMREFDFYSEVVKNIDICPTDIYFHDENISGYTTRIKNTSKKLNNKNYDLVIEMHFNSFNKKANGCETLYFYNSKKSRYLAGKFSKVVNRMTGIKLRHEGLKALANRKDRGFASVYYPKAPTILIEPFFGDNENDCAKIKNPKNLALIIEQFIKNISL